MKRLSLLFVFLLFACESHQPVSPAAPTDRDVRIAAARTLTDRYAVSRLGAWGIRASAAGADCGVLFITTSLILEESMIEALHYGAGAYDVYAGGVQQFSRDRSFRGVAYKDASEKKWEYGEVDSLAPCAIASSERKPTAASSASDLHSAAAWPVSHRDRDSCEPTSAPALRHTPAACRS